MGLQAELVDNVDALEPYLADWDALAAERGRPYCAPGWMLSWLRAVAPAGTLLRVCVVCDGEGLVAIAPFWTSGDDGGACYRLLAERTSYPVELLSVPGRETEAVESIAELLQHADPAPRAIDLKGAVRGAAWPQLLVRHLSGASPPTVTRTRVEPVPSVSLHHPSVDAWLASRSRNLRQQMRRDRRRLEAAGAEFRVSTSARLDRDVDSLARLHHARWSGRAGSRLLDSSAREMLRLAGRELTPERFRLLAIDVDGETISAHLFVRAGSTRAYWLGGFDERFAGCRPSMQVLVMAVADGIQHGDHLLELGPGAQDYKYRLSDCEETLEWLTLVPGPG